MRQLALGLTLSLILGACGTKGPLYQLPRQEAPSPLFVQAGAKLSLLPNAADQAACRPVCAAACGPEPSASEVAGARAPACLTKCLETCPSGAASGKPLGTAPRNDNKGGSFPALIPAP